jgi:hypothetical protein
MPAPVQPVKDFLNQLEKTLKTRQLYAANTQSYREASEKLFEKCQTAVAEGDFSLRVGPSDLFLGKSSVLNRDKRDESFFFPLYRDGLRELSFSHDATLEELNELLSVFEAERDGKIGPTEDTISFLWRCDLHGVNYRAIDGIGEEEGDGTAATASEEYSALVADVMSKIQDPAPASTGQTYAFVLDADARVSATDFHYESTTQHKSFEDNPTVLRLSPEEAAGLLAEVEQESDEELLERFVEVLFFTLMDPGGAITGNNVGPVLRQLLEGYWSAGDYTHVSSLLGRLQAASQVAPLPENRDAARGLITEFLTEERIREGTLEPLREGTVTMQQAAELWHLAGDTIWELLVEFWRSLPKGELHTGVGTYLRNRLATAPDLLRPTLTHTETELVRGSLALITEGLEKVYAEELFALIDHSEESVRLKAIAKLARIGNEAVIEALWKVMETDPAKPVRLLAFRLMTHSSYPQLAKRLTPIVTHADFASRPVWEREKYVRLLGASAGESTRPLFNSWIPGKRWFWQRKDYLALAGLAACGGAARGQVETMASGKGHLAEAAQKALENTPRSKTHG